MDNIILNNFNKLNTETIINYCVLINNYELLQYINNYTERNLRFLIFKIFENAIPSVKYVYSLNLPNLYECYMYLTSINKNTILDFYKATDKKDYSIILSETDYLLWIKDITFKHKCPILINILEYIDINYPEQTSMFLKKICGHNGFMKDILNSNNLFKYLKKSREKIFILDVLLNLDFAKININEHISLDELIELFVINDINSKHINLCLRQYLLNQYNIKFLENVDPEIPIFEDINPKKINLIENIRAVFKNIGVHYNVCDYFIHCSPKKTRSY